MRARVLVTVAAFLPVLFTCAQWPDDLPDELNPNNYLPPHSPTIEVSPSTVTMTWGTVATAESRILVGSAGTGGIVHYNVHIEYLTSSGWLSVTPGSGRIVGRTDTLILSFQGRNLSPGLHEARVLVTVAGVDTDTVLVTLAVPNLSVTPQTMRPTCVAGCPWPSSTGDRQLLITNTGAGFMRYTLRVEFPNTTGWLACIPPDSGSSIGETDTVALGYATAGLALGPHEARIIVTAAGLDTDTVVVTLTIVDTSSPQIGLSATVLSLACELGTQQIDTALRVWNAGSGVLAFSLAPDSAWLQCVPSADTSTTSADLCRIAVKALTRTMSIGTHESIIYVISPGLPIQMVTVRITVNPPFVVSRESLHHTCVKGSTPLPDTLLFWATSSPTTVSVNSTVPWAMVSRTTVTSTGPGNPEAIIVRYDSVALLDTGTHAGAIRISRISDSTSLTIGIRLQVTPPSGPAIAASVPYLMFDCDSGRSDSDTFSVWCPDGTPRSLKIAVMFDTLRRLTPSTITIAATAAPTPHTITLNAQSLAPGTYTDTIVISQIDKPSVRLTIPVSYRVRRPNPLVAGRRFLFTFGYNNRDSSGAHGWLRWVLFDPYNSDAKPDKYWGELVLDTAFEGGDRTPLPKNPSDSVLVAYRLTAAQEMSFSRLDNQPSSFWDASWAGRDYAELTYPTHVSPGHDGFGSARPSVRLTAAAGDSGVYLLFTVIDSSMLDRAAQDDWESDFLPFWIDGRSKGDLAGCQPGCLVKPAFGWSLTYTSRAYGAWLGSASPPGDIVRAAYDQIVLEWLEQHLTYAAAAGGHGAAFEIVRFDSLRKAVECRISWSELGLGQ